MNPNKYAYAGQPRSLEQSLRDEIADLRARCEKAEKDAERYQILRRTAKFESRNGPGLHWYLPRHLQGSCEEQLDQHLDSIAATIPKERT